MAVTEFSFLEVDGTVDNDLPLKGQFSHGFTAMALKAPVPEASDALLGLQRYAEIWTWPAPGTTETGGVELSQAEFEALMAVARTPVTKAATYPRLNVMTDDTPGWTLYPVEITTVNDTGGGDGFKRFVTVQFTRRSTSGSLTFVVDSGGGNAVTLDIPDVEAVNQLITIAGKNKTTEGTDSLSPTGPSPIACVVIGFAATGDLDKLQKTLKAKTAVEMVGLAFDTTGSGYFSTELVAGDTAVLETMQTIGRFGAKVLVQLNIVRDTTS